MTISCRLINVVLFIILIASNNTLAQTITVTLLGTGSPPPVMERFGPSILVEAGEQKFIFDAGRGVLQRLRQADVQYKDIQGVFFTHLHSDHVVGFPDLWLTGWLTGQRIAPLQVWGPKGTKKMVSNLEKAFEFDIEARISDNTGLPSGVVIKAVDIKEGVVFEKNAVKITAFEVDHERVKPAFGYRIDYAGRSAVLSGDTRYSENLIRYSKGVDLLIHEVVSPEALARMKFPAALAKTIIDYHTTPERAGEIFSLVKPRMAIFSHIIQPNAAEQDIIPPTRKTYAGAVELGEDLMVIEVGEKIEIRRPSAKTN
ncbi:MAG TPA: MBL fold metallo-hydrolase [Pyrinomonadaceae bacterium]